MIKILFVCHGNICRSPMAEAIFNHLAAGRGLTEVYRADSAAVSTEEIGNGVYPPARRELARNGIPVPDHRARQMTLADGARYDLIIGMDHSNLLRMKRILNGDPEGRCGLLMDWTDRPGEVADPWYNDRFDIAFRDIEEGCRGLLSALERGGTAP